MISVIVPVYNMEKYIDKCIKSIVEQTYTELEIILIDDGSTDHSLEICQKWAKADSRIVVLHKKNGGQGSARNLGLEIALGEYIGFIDSDDWIDPNMYQTLYDNMNAYDADVSCCSNGTFEEKGTGVIRIFEQPEIMLEHTHHHKGTGQSPCDKLYKKNVFTGIRFNELRAYEDCATIYRVLHNAKKVVWEDTTLYFYVTRPGSTMNQEFSSVKYQAVEAYFQMYTDYKQWHPEYACNVKLLLIGSIQFCIGETLVRRKKKEYETQYSRAVDIIKNIQILDLPFKSRILVYVMRMAPSLYGLIYKLFKYN